MAEPGTAYPCKSHAVCNGGEHVFYGWGRNAPKMEFPDGVGVAVGQGTELTVLVLQVRCLPRTRQHSQHTSLTIPPGAGACDAHLPRRPLSRAC